MNNAESSTTASSNSSSQRRGLRLLQRLRPMTTKRSIFPSGTTPMILRKKQEFANNDDRQLQEDGVAIEENDEKNDASSRQATIHHMLRQLSPDELETAARFSYDYLTHQNSKEELLNGISSKKSKINDKKTLQLHYAKKLAAIYLLKHSNDEDSYYDDDDEPESNKSVTASRDDTAERALADLKATLKFRQQFNVDQLRTAFDKQQQLHQQQHRDDAASSLRDCASRSSRRNDCSDNGSSSSASSSEFHETLYNNLQRQKNLYVQGYDRDGRSTYIFIPRNVQHFDATWTLREHVYTLERALACTKARDHKVNAVVDFNGYNRNLHAPPLSVGMEFLNVLGHYYGPCLNRVFIVDAPVAFLVIWTVLKPIVNKLASRNKVNIEFVQSTKTANNRHRTNSKNHHNYINVLERYYEPHQAASWMLPSGTKNRDLDVHEYLHQTPFNQAFDEQ
jgi:CRAL/TRIO domain